MSDRMPVGPALEQLRELISILRELANAGPRDNSFKQWRQVTLTLLQRLWPGDQTRATRFRRIPFSAPSSRSDAKTIRESYVRGVNEAMAYLESLVQEIEHASGKLGRSLVRPAEAPLAPARAPAPARAATPVEPPHQVASPTLHAGPLEPSPWEARPPADHAADDGVAAAAEPPPAQPYPPAPREPVAAPKQESGKVVTRQRQRLKDMLGFGEEGPTSADAAEAHAPSAAFQPSMPAPPPSVAIPPSRASEEEPPASALRLVPPAESVPDLDDDALAIDFDLTDGVGPDAESSTATLWEMLEREAAPRSAPPSSAAREVLSMASMVDQLGVPPDRRAIVRAALIDLGHQMDAPPIQWVAIRQALAFMLDYPEIARRVIPMLVPYLDEAA